ncbi:MAG: GAF domain-containing sensor histidine kinase [Anaerolineae bacterium]|nr:GAF domain-containing sensor histidine kinase [Anaerolineae bacterium]
MISRFNLSTKRLRWLAVILPIAFWVLVLAAQYLLFPESWSWLLAAFEVAAITIGATIFSFWIFEIVQEREAEIERRSQQLSALHDAAIALTTELELTTVLQKVVDLSRDLVGAKYAALGVLQNNGRSIEQIVTAGLTPEQRALMGDLPRGHGLLGALIHEGKAIRIPNITNDARSVGFPPHHPSMKSLLGVPIRFKGRIIGDLYMTDKLAPDGSTTIFSSQDQDVLEMFATQAAIAIENAQLYRQKQQLAILQERERFGMDLHDGIIQSIYAIGLQLDDAELRIRDEPLEAGLRVHQAILGLNDVIRDIRNYILDLRPQRFQGRDLKRGLEELARDLRANTFLNVNVTADTIEPELLSPEQTVEILHLAQEALTNVRKHARASQVELDLVRDADAVLLTVQDDGVGIENTRDDKSGGNGLPNMRERARAARGSLWIERGEPTGTRVSLKIPVKRIGKEIG